MYSGLEERAVSGASKKISRCGLVILESTEEKGVLPVPTTVTGPTTRALPL